LGEAGERNGCARLTLGFLHGISALLFDDFQKKGFFE
jgi:hypothetical protein